MSKYTKGPWVTEADPMLGKYSVYIKPADSYAIASVFSRNKSDAKLIAAAPDLLEALEKAVNRQGFSNDELIAAREVINKAKGAL